MLAMSRRLRLVQSRRAIAIAVTMAVSATAVVAGVAAPAALANVYAVASCNYGGQPQPTDGWTSAGSGNNSGAYNSCAAGGTFGAGISSAAPQPAGLSVVWTFAPPAGATVAGGTISGGLVVPYGQGGGAYFAAPTANYDFADVIANCQWNLPCPQSAAPPGPGSYAGTFPINPGGNVYAVASCTGLPGGQGCPAGNGSPEAAFVIATATIELSSSATPTASGFTGSLLANPTHGTGILQFLASSSDSTQQGGGQGGGVFRVEVDVDGHSVYGPQTPDGNGGKCSALGTDPSGANVFAWVSPCRSSETVTVPVATAGLADGAHALKVIVTNASGSSSTVLNTTIQTLNRTTSSSHHDSAHPPATGPGGAPLGPANGQGGGDPHAILLPSYAATSKTTPTVTYAHSGMTLSGRLVDHTGAAIPGAQIELRQHPAAAGATDALLATATTTATGGWTLPVPPGPSRTITVGYRAHLGDPAFAAQLDQDQLVLAPVSLRAPRRAHRGGRVVMHGQLAGGHIPTGGELVAMQIQFLGVWRTIDLVHASATDGRWRYTYLFRGLSPGKYRFRAVVSTNPAYPFLRATSQVTIEVR